MKITYKKITNQSFGILNLQDDYDEKKRRFNDNVEMLLIPNPNWRKDYLFTGYFNEQELFQRYCLIDIMLYKIIYPKKNKMWSVKSDEMNPLEIALGEILNFDLYCTGCNEIQLYKKDKVKIKMLTILLENGYIKLFRERERNHFVIVATSKLFEELDKGFDGFRLIYTKKLNSKFINEIYLYLINSKDYYQCFVEKSTKLILNKN